MLVIYICTYISTCALIRSHTGMCMYLYMHTHHYALLRNVYMYNDLYIYIYMYMICYVSKAWGVICIPC